MNRRSFLSLILLLILSLSAAWPEAGLSVDVIVGWNGVVRAGKYAPLIVGLENPGKKIACTVSLDTSTGSELRGTLLTRTYSQPVSLAARSQKRLFFTFPVSTISRSITVRVNSPAGEVYRKDVAVGEMAVSQRLVVGVSSELSLDFLSDMVDGVRVVYPHMENLPESWVGYDGIDAVVVHDTAFQNLRGPQTAALEQWIFSGGILVVSGGPSALQLKSAGLDRLLPVEVTGLVPRSGISSLGRLLGVPTPPKGNMILAASRLTSGTVLAEEDGIPILAVRRIGQGYVRFLAFDCAQPPVTEWQGNPALWRLIIGDNGRHAADRIEQNPAVDPWLKNILGMRPFSFPQAVMVLGLLSVYLAAAAPFLNRQVSKRVRSPARAVILLVVAVAVSVSGWLLFDRILFHGNAFILTASTAESVSGDGLARVTEKIGLFTSSGRVFDLSTPLPNLVIEDTIPSRSIRSASTLKIVTGDGTRVEDLRLGRFSSRLLTLDTLVEMDVRVSLSQYLNYRIVSISNGSRYDLSGSFLSIGGMLYPLGDIPAGVQLRRALLPAGNLESRREEGGTTAVTDPLRLAFWEQVKAGFHADMPTLFAWLERPLIPMTASSGMPVGAGPSLNLVGVYAE
jgi:hypothetical protein